jgi:hypothetical protein
MERFGKFEHTNSSLPEKKEKEKKQVSMHELTIHHLGKARYAHCSMQAHFGGPK